MILGPGGRGVAIATEDPKAATFDRLTLRAAGIPGVLVEDLGLTLHERPPTPEEAAARWAVVTRRVAIVREGDRLAIGRPDGSVAVQEPPSLSSDMLRLEAPPPRVAIFGGAWTAEDEPDYGETRRFGESMAAAGVHVLCGGYGGVMEAAARGASEAGGVAIGVTISAWTGRVTPSPWLTHRADAVSLLARYPLLLDADAWVAFPGGVGTLAEVAQCWNLMQMSIDRRPLIAVGDRWGRILDSLRKELIVHDPGDLELASESGASEAAEAVLAALGR